MSRKPQRAPITSVSEGVKSLNSRTTETLVPEGVELDEMAQQFLAIHTSTRETSDWTPSQRLMLVHAARLEADIFRHNARAQEEGEIVTLGNGTIMPHPSLKLAAQCERNLFALYSKLGLTADSNNAATANRRSAGVGFVSSQTVAKEGQPDWSKMLAEKQA